jgi:hypothetical protein
MRPADALAYRRLTAELSREHLRALGHPDARELQRDKKLLDELTLHTIVNTLPTDNVFYVAADMTSLAIGAAASVPEITRAETTLATPYGFMVFEDPIGESVGQMEPGPLKHRMLEESRGRLTDDGRIATPVQGFMWKVTEGPESRFVYAWLSWVRHNTLYPIDWATLPFGEGVSGTLDAEERLGDELAVHDLEKRLWVTHILMQQRLAWSESLHPERPERRRWMRAGLPPSDVGIVKLRRVVKAVEDESESSIAWTHRWLVDGHWRQQWYPSTSSNRPVWISPYIKGPEDKPLVLKEKVMVWVR